MLPVKKQVICLFLLCAGIVLPVLTATIVYFKFNDIETVIKEKGEAKAELLSILSIDALIVKDRPELQTIINGLRAQEPGLISIQIVDSADQTIAFWQHTDAERQQRKQVSTIQTIAHANQEFGSLRMVWDYKFFSAPIVSKLLKNAIMIVFISIVLLMMIMLWLKYSFIKPLEYLDRRVSALATGGSLSKVESPIRSIEFRNLDQSLDQTERMLVTKAEDDAKMIRAQEQVKAANELAKSRMDFLSLMSHEIRTPLGVMLGFGKLLESADLDEEENDFLSNINESGEYLQRIINDILDLSKIEANGISLEVIPISLLKIINDLDTMLGTQAKQKGIKFCTEYDGVDSRVFNGDMLRIKQVLMNLGGNAIKFTDEGTVKINVSVQDRGAKPSKVRFEVSDTGIGMSSEGMASIFDPFAQADCSTSRKFGGTGLGLSISKQLVELMGGTLAVSSQVGEGSVFSFELEMVKSDQPLLADEPVKTQETLNHQESKLSILVAEDELANRILVEKVLERYGYSIEFACDGQECVDIISSNRHFDVIFLDLHMPKLGGMDIAKKIRDGELGSDVQDVSLAIMSADVLAEDEGKGVGVDAFISKPLDFEELNQFLKQAEDTNDNRVRHDSSRKILVVEDQKMNQVLLGELVKRHGGIPTFANDGCECVDILESGQRFDAIFLDLRMPRMDGFEVAKAIRSGSLGREVKDVPIAVISAEIVDEECRADLNVDEFFSKPLAFSDVESFVDELPLVS